jgi:hypothetical protein
MLKLLLRLLGLTTRESKATRNSNSTASTTPSIPRASGGGAISKVIDKYFKLSMAIEQAKSDHDYPRAIRAARETYEILPAFVDQWKKENGVFEIPVIYAISVAPTLMAVMEDGAAIRELRTVLNAIPELRDRLPSAEEADKDLAVVSRMMAAIRREPGVSQSALKSRLEQTAAHVSRLAAWLEKGRRIFRIKDKNSYRLYPAGFVLPASNSVSSNSRRVGSATGTVAPSLSANQQPPAVAPLVFKKRSAAGARLIDFAKLPVVRLPAAPPYWEARAAEDDKHTDAQKVLEEKFSAEGDAWLISRVEKLPPADRPDPVFKRAFRSGNFTYWLDEKGKRVGFELFPAVLRVVDREGRVVAEQGLPYDVYRSDITSDGSGILFLSREGMLHGYSSSMDSLIQQSIADLPEYEAQANRLGIDPRELKNHVRCVALSRECDRFLVTVVDEAWLMRIGDCKPLWGLRMPSQDGWTRRVSNRSDSVGSSAEVADALRVMDLALPIAPEDLTRQYRILAMRWHPDRNPGDPNATRHFQELGRAMNLLTGSDLSYLSATETDRITYEKVLSTHRVEVPDPRDPSGARTINFDVGASMVIGEKAASDWIYAANIGQNANVFLAGYSGKAVVVSASGEPERVYDIGAAPRHIAETKDHLYILTDTRLYVLSGDRLEALIDVFGTSDVFVADYGFALVGQKSFTWFTSEGKRVGSIETKDPLRRVAYTADGLVVETRQHRAYVSGAPAWWE